MIANPRVSVLMPVRNGLPWLRAALDSLGRQTLEDFELIVLDDGSTDGTSEILAMWKDYRLRVIPTGGVGIAAALNRGLAAARAPMIARHDADDLSAPVRLAAQAAFLAARTDVGVVATAAEYIDADGRPVDNDWVRTVRAQQDPAQTPAQIRALMPLTCCVTHGSIMARAGVLRAAGGYRQAAAPAEDYELWLRLLPATPFAKLPERLYTYRVHDRQVMAVARERQLMQALTAKFAYLRRVCRLPSPARLVVLGAGRGAACFRALAGAHGFDTVAPPPALRREKLGLLANGTVRRWALEAWDALVVTEFADLGAYREALGVDDGAAVQIGNMFVPRRWAARQAA